MTTIKLLLAAFSFVLLSSFATNDLPKDFSKLLARAKMTLEKIDGFEETTPIKNRQMNYEYALINKEKNFEVRYAIRPLDNLIKDYKEKEKNKKALDINIHPNNLYEALLQVTILNISGGKLPESTVFGKNAVKKEFNADWGAVTFVEVGEEFGQKYKYCAVVAIHKDNVGDAYCFYLSETQENITENMKKLFHALKFK